jgi:hypothetical protein
MQRYIPHNEVLRIHFKKEKGFKVYRYIGNSAQPDPSILSNIFDNNISHLNERQLAKQIETYRKLFANGIGQKTYQPRAVGGNLRQKQHVLMQYYIQD